MVAQWFRRLAVVPGLDFQGSPGIDRTALSGHDAEPQVVSYASPSNNSRHESLLWSTPDGMGSASPAHSRAFRDVSSDASQDVLRNLYEALELPGEASDYHFAIQGAAEAFWSRRRREPELFETIERLCWLDIRLLIAAPEAIMYEVDGERHFAVGLAFDRLVYLYEREGLLREALQVAEIAVRFDQGHADLERIRDKVVRLEAELC